MIDEPERKPLMMVILACEECGGAVGCRFTFEDGATAPKTCAEHQVLTTEITVTCSYCGAEIVVPFRHGAVMPDWRSEVGVSVHVPVLCGGDHDCPSERHRQERALHLRSERERAAV